MHKFIPYILKTLWRHRSRTILTVSGSAVALFVFCFVGAVQEGMNDLRRRQQEKRSLITFQANKFCPATSHLPQDYEQQISRLPGVREVIPIQVFTNNCRASLDVVVFYGVPPEKLQIARDFQLESGSWSEFEQHQDAAVVGRSVARRRAIGPGDKFSIGDLSVTVAGIFTSEDPAEENYIYSHQETRIYIPQARIQQGADGPFVWVADQSAGVARQVQVQVGAARGAGLVEVVEGLTSSSRLIVSGLDGLQDGDRIRVTGEQSPFDSDDYLQPRGESARGTTGGE